MKSTLPLFLAAALLFGCDHGGTAPDGTGALAVGGAVGNGGSGGTVGGGTGGGTGGGGSNSGGTVIFGSTQLQGPVTLTGGTSREALFFLAQDRSLHILASSDGANGETTTGRETIWDIQVESTDSISWSNIGNSSEQPFRDTISTYMDYSNPSFLQYAIHFRLYTIAGGHEYRIATASSALLSVTVQAASGVNDLTVGWTPPALSSSATGQLVRLGTAQTIAGTASFEIQMPGGGSN
jgi:hypothetical protein